MKTKPLFYGSREFRLTVCNEVAILSQAMLNTPQAIADYLFCGLAESPFYRPDRENFIAVFLNTRLRPIGFEIISQGILDSVLVHPREVFRPAIVSNASSIVVAHNHPSGEIFPSQNDIKVTKELIMAGKIVKIEIVDHLILGEKTNESKGFCSLKELGFIN